MYDTGEAGNQGGVAVTIQAAAANLWGKLRGRSRASGDPANFLSGV